MESFFASLKKEYFYRREYATIEDVKERSVLLYRDLLQQEKTAQQPGIYESCSLQTEGFGA